MENYTNTEAERIEKRVPDVVLKENVKANSEQTPHSENGGLAVWAFDDEVRWWHSRWEGTPIQGEATNGIVSENNPIWIQTGFGKVEYIKKLMYLPRQDKPYGRIDAYEVQIANMGNQIDSPEDEDFVTVKAGKLQNKKSEGTITLDTPTVATHIRLVTKAVYENAPAGAEGDPQSQYAGSHHVAAQRIKIYAVEPVSLKVTAGKTEYFVGDGLDKAQMSATLTFSDGSAVNVMENVEITGFDTSSPVEAQEVTVTYNAFTYGEFTDTFTVTVKTDVAKKIDELKRNIRVKSETAKEEIEGLVLSCKKDLEIVGVYGSLGDPLYFQAVKLYCKANYGYDENAERFREAYESLRDSMALSGDYKRKENTNGNS